MPSFQHSNTTSMQDIAMQKYMLSAACFQLWRIQWQCNYSTQVHKTDSNVFFRCDAMDEIAPTPQPCGFSGPNAISFGLLQVCLNPITIKKPKHWRKLWISILFYRFLKTKKRICVLGFVMHKQLMIMHQTDGGKISLLCWFKRVSLRI